MVATDIINKLKHVVVLKECLSKEKMIDIKILFDRLDRKYSPGDRINLEIHVLVDSDTTFRSIYARMHGFAHVEWIGHKHALRSGKHYIAYKTYTGHENYFKNYKTIAGSHKGPEIRLAVGSHVYYVSYILPQCLPRNHEGGNGYIRYEAKVHMEVPWDFDKKETAPFLVRSYLDLNKYPILREPVRVESKKKFGFFCWQSDPLRVYNVLPRRGFVPGECIKFILELNNDSDVPISGATVKLLEKIVYHAQSSHSSTRERQRILWEHTFTSRDDPLVAAMQNKIFSTDLFFDPAWGFHFFDGCKIITVAYVIVSQIRMPAYHENIYTSTPITIGTIPFGYSGVPVSFPSIVPVVPPSNTISTEQTGTRTPSISDQPLPSYYDTVYNPQIATELGWAQANRMESPPPSFTDVEMNKGQ